MDVKEDTTNSNTINVTYFGALQDIFCVIQEGIKQSDEFASEAKRDMPEQLVKTISLNLHLPFSL